MTEEDKKLLVIYKSGWDDSADENDNEADYSGLELKAYQLGWDHWIIGDDVRSVDYLSQEEILKLIKEE